jgi:hypothetical protein
MASKTYRLYPQLQTASIGHPCHSHPLVAQELAAVFAVAQLEVCHGSFEAAVHGRNSLVEEIQHLCGWAVSRSASRSDRCMRLAEGESRSLLAVLRIALRGGRSAVSWEQGAGAYCSPVALRKFVEAVMIATTSVRPEGVSMGRMLPDG